MSRRLNSLLQMPQTDIHYIPFGGGLDEVTPPLNAQPGTCRLAQNYEIGVNGGYNRVDGYERFDGQASPSDATYSIMGVTVTGSLSVGDTITGVTSMETAVIIAIPSATQIVITKVSGAFNASETLNVSGSPEATTTTAAFVNSATTSLLHATYLNLAADEYRGDITAVTGSDGILGLCVLNDVVYAFRNNAGGTAAALYKSSSSGWTAVALGFELSFTSGGTTEIAEGDTITGATSGSTAVLTRVVLESGTWAGGDAAGRFIFASQSAAFQAENINVGASTNLATIAGDSSAITLSPDGRYETVKHNFGSGERIYGCDKVNRGFEFDGTVFVPIATGMATDTPTHVTVFREHLFFAFEGSAQHSGTGTPYQFTLLSGAAELATGEPIVGFQHLDSSGLGLIGRNRIHVLYGTSSADWQLEKYREEIGAVEYTVQSMASILMLDDRGVVSLRGAQSYGNFNHSTLSAKVKPFIKTHHTNAIASCIVREKNQYRLFFSDKYALYMTFDGNKLMGSMPVVFPDTPTCVWSGEFSDGTEKIFMGASDGFVYQLDKGTSFDGDAIEYFLNLHFWHLGSPRRDKRFYSCALETQGTGYTELNFAYELDYNTIESPQVQIKSSEFFAVLWDSFVWDSFVWDGSTLVETECEMDGVAENVSIILRGNSDYFFPAKLSGILIRYALTGRQKRS